MGEIFDLPGRRIFVETAGRAGQAARFYDFTTEQGWKSAPEGAVELTPETSASDIASLQTEFVQCTGIEVFGLARLLSAGPASGRPGEEGSLAFAGREERNGREVLVLSHRPRAAEGGGGEGESRYLFDADSRLLVAKRTIVSREGLSPVESEYSYSDYRRLDGGILLPFRIELRDRGAVVSEIAVDRIALRDSIDPAILRRPEPK